MLRAKDIMVRDIIVVTPQSPLLEAMEHLVHKGVSGLPVVDAAMNIVGVITEKDVLRLLVSDVITKNQIVGDYMSREVKSFSPDDSVLMICEFFMENHFRRVPIVENGKLVGVISRHDIITLILKSSRE